MMGLGETSKLRCCSADIMQPAAAKLYRKSYTQLSNTAAFWLKQVVINVDVSSQLPTQNKGNTWLNIALSHIQTWIYSIIL